MTSSAAFTPPRRRARPILLTLSLILSGFLALSVHIGAARWGIPYPHGDMPLWANWLNISGALGGVLILLKLRDAELGRAAVLRKMVLAFVVLFLINGLFRKTIMEGFATDAFAFAFITGTLSLVRPLLLAGFASVVANRVRFGLPLVIASLVLGAAAMAGEDAGQAGLNHLIDLVAYLGHPEIYVEPYPLWFEVASYLFFAEIVLGAAFLAFLVWDRLEGGFTLRVAKLAGLVTLLTGSLIKDPLYALTVAPDFGAGIVSYGQFTVQFLVLGAFVALSWESFGWRSNDA